MLQGFKNDMDFKAAKEVLLSLTVLDMLGQQIAIAASNNYHSLRKKASPSGKP
jgi:hypothetical protein